MLEFLSIIRLLATVALVAIGAYYMIIAYTELEKRIGLNRSEVKRAKAEAHLLWAQARRAEEDIELVPATATGHLPVSRRLLNDGSMVAQQLSLIAQDIATRTPVQPVPATVHYAPHFARVDAPTKVDLDGDNQPEPQPVKTPNFWELWTAGELPDNGFLMGHNLADGSPVYADWKKLYSALIGGTSGSGKSTLIRNVLTQSAIQGGRFVVLDKHFSAGEESLGASIYPLRNRLMCDIAATEEQMLRAIKLMRHIGSQRLSGKDHDKSPVIMVVDETTALLSRSDIAEQLKALLGEIAQETRKVGVYAMCIGQNFHSEVMPTTVRNSFVSFLSCRTRSDVARVMTGSNEFGKVAGQLRIGQCVWMDNNGEMIRIAIPNTTQKHVEMIAREIDGMLVQPEQAVIVPAEREVEIPANAVADAVKVRMVKDLLANCASQKTIIKEVWGISGGRKYPDAAKELSQIIALLTRTQ